LVCILELKIGLYIGRHTEMRIGSSIELWIGPSMVSSVEMKLEPSIEPSIGLKIGFVFLAIVRVV
jgi:hypothetical protein